MSKIYDQDLYNLLAKKLAGETNARENRQLDQWIKSSDEAKEALSNAHHIWTSHSFDVDNPKLVGQEEASDKIWNEVFENESNKNSYRDYSLIAKIAATVVLFFVAAFIVFKVADQPELEETKVTKITKKAPPGQKSTFSLRDGTIVWLNSGSSISYWSDYNDSIRLIELEGQAFFDVFKDPSKPFLVKCRDLKVEALGTSFDVNGYDDSPIQVSLLTGKVMLSLPMISKNNDEIILLPGEYSVLGSSNEFIDKGMFDSYEVLAWKEGRLIFDDATMDEIIPKLELWYGVEITNEMSTNLRKPFNGTFEKENLDNILLNMAGPLQFDYEIEGNIIIIKN